MLGKLLRQVCLAIFSVFIIDFMVYKDNLVCNQNEPKTTSFADSRMESLKT